MPHIRDISITPASSDPDDAYILRCNDDFVDFYTTETHAIAAAKKIAKANDIETITIYLDPQ